MTKKDPKKPVDPSKIPKTPEKNPPEMPSKVPKTPEKNPPEMPSKVPQEGSESETPGNDPYRRKP